MTDRDPAERMVAAAQAWLDSLDEEQREAAQWAWPAEEERHRWYYTPTDHGGLPLARMAQRQQQRAMKLVAAGLSRPGFVTVSTILGLENVLDQLEGWQVDWERERGRDPQLYYLRVFGEPTMEGPWSWRFGGHHVSVQHVVLNGTVQGSTPTFLGADPAASPLLGGHLLRPLGALEDLARELVRSLDDEQTAKAVISAVAPTDIVTGNRPRVGEGDKALALAEVWRGRFDDPKLNNAVAEFQRQADQHIGITEEHHDQLSLTAKPKGVNAAEMSPQQREQLRAVLMTFLGRAPDELAEREAAKFAGDAIKDVSFAWAGSTEPGKPHYYRLQGPRLLAEYDNTQRDANHVHTVWRDPLNDFGDDVLAQHIARYHR
ncbi:DUF3500 domain-containing protein [Kutzneria chonburiensis]|uniref:DUF3500 domain-containing protein n=1 Tax=Kutzneria chonburiensis TaxID=1483604 RepID=A0ABV6MKQ9_9PSEU|nr:DUF3500 domain-containing protein [Kutzneria chonburiensis]